MLWCKAALIIWGALSTGTQLLLTGHCGDSLRRSAREQQRARVDDAIDVQTVASRLRNSFARTRSTGCHKP
jgi:hypothetical protein